MGFYLLSGHGAPCRSGGSQIHLQTGKGMEQPVLRNPRLFLVKEKNCSPHLTMMWFENENQELREISRITEEDLGWEGP